MRGRQRLESILRKGTNVFFGLLAEGDNQRRLGEDGDKLKVVNIGNEFGRNKLQNDKVSQCSTCGR